jgi:dTDP-L-rhamnose 4-epimerase
LKKQVLLTGGAGFIGLNTIRYIQTQSPNDFEFILFDNLHPQVHKQFSLETDLPPNTTLLTGDVANKHNWDTVLKLAHPDIVIHLAAETGTGQSLTESSRHARVNVVGTTEMLDALRRNNIKPEHIILASSRAVYGDGDWKNQLGEVVAVGTRTHAQLDAGQWDYQVDDKKLLSVPSRADKTSPRPTNIYAATKLAQEHICKAWCSAFEIPLTILRFQNVYGPGQSLDNSYTGIVALFSKLTYEKKPISVFEDGMIIRDFVYVEDVSQAVYKSVLNIPALHEDRVLDVGYGEAVTVLDVAKKIAQIGDAPDPIITGQYRDGDVRAASCDISRTKETIGYDPQWNITRGLTSLYEWVKQDSEKTKI